MNRILSLMLMSTMLALMAAACAPAVTPSPSPTSPPPPTATPEPTATDMPTLTVTRAVTATRTPTHTPGPTLTPRPAFAGQDLPPFRVEGRFLYDGCGEKVVLRGVNKMVIWTDRDGDPAFAEIAKSGANVVRISWLMEGSAAELDIVLQNAIRNQLIPMVDLHDAIGKWKRLPELVDYWVRPDIVEVLNRYQSFVLVNIANEIAPTVASSEFIARYSEAVTRMRAAGLHMPLVIDAPELGQGLPLLHNSFEQLIAADPDHNLLFSVHAYWPRMWGNTDEHVTRMITNAVNAGMPLVIGEFGNKWEESPEGEIPYLLIIDLAQQYEIGWIAWSWGPGNNPQTFLDMTADGTFATLKDWGLEVAVTDPNSIQNTAIRPYSIVHGKCR